MTRILRRLVAAVVGLSTVAALASCGSTTEGPNPSPSVVPGATPGGSLRIGISFDQPGLGFKDGDTYTGFDVDTATYIAKSLGVPADKINWVEANPANRENLLTTGAVDLVLSTYSITEERKEVVDFAGPYFEAHQDLLVRRNEEEISGPETLDDRVLCSVTGTTSAALVKERFKGEIELREYARFSECVAALERSEVDAVTTDDVILAGFAAQPQYQGKLRVVGEGFSDELYGVGIKKGNSTLVEQVNTALKAYVADGSWEASLERNVRPSGYEIPDPPAPGS
jgi:glutamate transport system substrate-binding protein